MQRSYILAAILLAGAFLLAVVATSPPAIADPEGQRPLAPAAATATISAEQSTPESNATSDLAPGDAVRLYDRYCLACHGTFGDGKGPGAPWLWPRPRDFTRGEYKWRSTLIGTPPTDADLAAAIRYGVPGTSMHAFADTLHDGEIAALVGYVKAFAPEVFARAASPIDLPPAPPITEAMVKRGQELYPRLGCAACHGDQGRGDGPAAAGLRSAEDIPLPPYDLTAMPLRRPRPATPTNNNNNNDNDNGNSNDNGNDNDDGAIAAIFASLATGLTGTPMPGYRGAVPDDDLWAVAAFIDSIRFRGIRQPGDPTKLHPAAIELDRKERQTRGGYWPGHGTEGERGAFGGTIPVQGQAPASLAPAQASLSAQQCARCHAKQVREWRQTLHGKAFSPGLLAQIINMTPKNGPTLESCQRCHAPLAEQLPFIRPGHMGGDDTARSYKANPFYDRELRHEGINCASCHVRGWQRLGPPATAASNLLALPGYPQVEVPMYERADFCIGCHQLPPRNALNGRPLLNTYREWLEGPYMRRGIQCQHCHMPNREHTWKGVHDPDTFRQGIAVDAIAGRSRPSGVVSVRARITNVGAGHYLPTTPTPAAWLIVELVDKGGNPIPGARREKRIGRHLVFERGFREVEDTRIPPGESLELAAAWKDGAVAKAHAARIRVRVVPDEYYERLYRQRLASRLTAEVRALFEEALTMAEANQFFAHDELVPIKSVTK